MITPFKKPARGEFLDWQKEFNTGVNKIRWIIERAISHLKNWSIMSTDYRRPFKPSAQPYRRLSGYTSTECAE